MLTCVDSIALLTSATDHKHIDTHGFACRRSLGPAKSSGCFINLTRASVFWFTFLWSGGNAKMLPAETLLSEGRVAVLGTIQYHCCKIVKWDISIFLKFQPNTAWKKYEVQEQVVAALSSYSGVFQLLQN